jgi:hypothetical protein
MHNGRGQAGIKWLSGELGIRRNVQSKSDSNCGGFRDYDRLDSE